MGEREKILSSIRERHGMVGDILSMMATLDFYLIFVISKYICKNDKEKIKFVMPLIDSSRNFHVKIKALKELSKFYSNFFNRHSELISNIEAMQELRNKLAHGMAKDEGRIIAFVKANNYGSNELSVFPYDKEKHIDNIIILNKSIESLKSLIEII